SQQRPRSDCTRSGRRGALAAGAGRAAGGVSAGVAIARGGGAKLSGDRPGDGLSGRDGPLAGSQGAAVAAARLSVRHITYVETCHYLYTAKLAPAIREHSSAGKGAI